MPMEEENEEVGGTNVVEINNEVDSLEQEGVESNDLDETEFRVNLNRIPPTLQNTTLSDKVYLNESVQHESTTPEDLDTISAEDMSSLYTSLDLNPESFMTEEQSSKIVDIVDTTSTTKAEFRKEALHLFGVDELSTQEVFDYFAEFKAFAVEWINDSSCNVVWRDPMHAANALLGLSVNYNGVREESHGLLRNEKDGELAEEVEELENGELVDEDGELENTSKFAKRLPPPGCRWRKGVKSIKNHQIFMRFVRKTDKKIKGAESKSKYYVKYGNPNYGNMRGLLSNSMRSKLKNRQQREAESGLDEEDEGVDNQGSDNDDDDDDDKERRPVAYDFDDHSNSHLSDGEIEEFGTSKQAPKQEFENRQVEVVELKLVTKSKQEFENRKKMGLYADELVSEQRGKRLLYSEKEVKDERTLTKKSRYQPYSISTKTRPENLTNRLSGLRSDTESDRMYRSEQRIDRDREPRDNRRNKRSDNYTYKKHSDSSRYVDDAKVVDDEDSNSPPRVGLRSTVVPAADNDLRSRLNRFK